MIFSLQKSRLVRSLVVCASFIAMLFGNAGIALAGFGITPPYVNNDRLTRGSSFSQTIMLVRSDPTDDLDTTITMNIPGIEHWVSIDRGMHFTLPKGQTAVPIVITVDVPPNADFKEYKGVIRIRTSSPSTQQGTGVSIALGAQIDVDLKVVDKIYDFQVRRVRIVDLEEGRTRWGLFFPGKIRFFMTIQNTGNTTYGPSRVHFDIYDSDQENLLESVDNTNKIEQIPAFTTKEIVAELPTRLPQGSYVAKYTIYKGDQIAQQNTVNMSIAAVGVLPGYQGYGFDGLSLADKLKVVAALGIPLILIFILIFLLAARRKRRSQGYAAPTR